MNIFNKTLASIALLATTSFANAAIIETTASLAVSGNLQFDSAGIEDQFAQQTPGLTLDGLFGDNDYFWAGSIFWNSSVNGVLPSFDQVADWSLSGEGSYEYSATISTIGGPLPVDGSDAGSFDGLSLGTGSLSNFFAAPITDYDDILTSLFALTGPSATLEEAFNAANSLVNVDLSGLLSTFLSGDDLTDLVNAASTVSIALVSDTQLVFASTAPTLSVDGFSVSDAALDFGGVANLTASYEVQEVPEPSAFILLLSGLAMLVLRIRRS